MGCAAPAIHPFLGEGGDNQREATNKTLTVVALVRGAKRVCNLVPDDGVDPGATAVVLIPHGPFGPPHDRTDQPHGAVP